MLKRLPGAFRAFWRALNNESPEGVPAPRRLTASRLDGLGVSKIRSTSTKGPSNAIDLASGVPQFPTPSALMANAVEAINAGFNQYAPTNGDDELRKLIADSVSKRTGREVSIDEVTITSGTSSALAGCLLAFVDIGPEVIVLEPYFESYSQMIRFAGGVPRPVRLNESDWTLDLDALRAAFNSKTRAVIVNSPNNPTGRVFSREELEAIAALCEEHDCLLISDEIYSQITFDRQFVSVYELTTNRSRNIVIDGMSKAFCVTGWRLGYVVAPSALSAAYRVTHSVLGLSAPTPLQVGARIAFTLTLNEDLRAILAHCRKARDLLCHGLRNAGLEPVVPEGATYVFADVSPRLKATSMELARSVFATKTGILTVAGSCFYEKERSDRLWLRFCFARDLAAIQAAVEQLRLLAD